MRIIGLEGHALSLDDEGLAALARTVQLLAGVLDAVERKGQ